MMFQQKRMHVLIGYALGVGALATTSTLVLAQEKIERVEITGSAIKRSINSETALPVTILDVKSLRESGITSVEEAMTAITGNQTGLVTSSSVGSLTGGKSTANLRALGSNKTLVLLNGRRLASFAFDSSAVDLNAIPLAAIERIEVLRDGASAIYGTDAIGGVINFITRRDYSAGEIALETTYPRANGGSGEETRFSLSKGFGNLDKDGWNFWAAYDNRNQAAIQGDQRAFAKSTKSSGTTWPGNWSQPSTNTSGNPSLPGCATAINPFSAALPGLANCRFLYTNMVDLIPPTTTETITGRGNFKLGSQLASIEVLHGTNSNRARVAPDPVTGITLNPGSPYYPTTGLPAGFNPAAPVSVGWRMIPIGQRNNLDDTFMDRAVGTLKGSLVKDWDYEAGIFWTQSRARDDVLGYASAPRVKAQASAGLLNPFGAPTAAEQALLNSDAVVGNEKIAKGTTQGVDFRLSGEVGNLPGGRIGVSAGVEARKEKYQIDTNDFVTDQIQNSSGQTAYHGRGDRDVKAFTLEALVPVHKMLEVQLAARMDRYSDFGSTTNPKVGFKFQPVKSFLVRGSWNKGFRAPTLDDLYGPQSVTFSQSNYNDPILCPGGTANVAAGGVSSRDCLQQVQVQQGGNPKLKPETSKTHSLGAVFQPTRDLQFSVDYWNIDLKNTVGGLPEQTIMANPVTYAGKIVRCNTLSAAVQATLERCSGLSAGSSAIGYIISLTDNLGATKTDGWDFGASYTFKTDRLGRFTLTYSGTKVNSYKYQNTPDDSFHENVGTFADNGPVFRWQHVVNVHNTLANWSTILTIRNKSGYTDQNLGDEGNQVGSYTLTDITTTYTGFKNLSLTAGIKNLLDKDPPFSNQANTFQANFDPRYVDPTGRAVFLRGSYKF